MACKPVLQYTSFWEDQYLADEIFERNQKAAYKKKKKKSLFTKEMSMASPGLEIATIILGFLWLWRVCLNIEILNTQQQN